LGHPGRPMGRTTKHGKKGIVKRGRENKRAGGLNRRERPKLPAAGAIPKMVSGEKKVNE